MKIKKKKIFFLVCGGGGGGSGGQWEGSGWGGQGGCERNCSFCVPHQLRRLRFPA